MAEKLESIIYETASRFITSVEQEILKMRNTSLQSRDSFQQRAKSSGKALNRSNRIIVECGCGQQYQVFGDWQTVRNISGAKHPATLTEPEAAIGNL